MNKFALILSVYLAVTTVSAATITVDDLKGKTISICDDGAEWPPYTYYKRVDGKKSKEIIGFSVAPANAHLLS